MPTVKVNGMTCQHCVMAVTKALSAIDGVTNVKVDLEAGTATYDESGPIDAAVVRSAIEEAGYEVG